MGELQNEADVGTACAAAEIARLDQAENFEIVFEGAAPSPSDSRDVLAFVLSRPEHFADDEFERQAIEEMLTEAKIKAILQWHDLARQARMN